MTQCVQIKQLKQFTSTKMSKDMKKFQSTCTMKTKEHTLTGIIRCTEPHFELRQEKS